MLQFFMYLCLSLYLRLLQMIIDLADKNKILKQVPLLTITIKGGIGKKGKV